MARHLILALAGLANRSSSVRWFGRFTREWYHYSVPHASPTWRGPEPIGGRLDCTCKRQHDVAMRATLTLDPDVARRLEIEMLRRGTTLKETVNEALRKGLGLAQCGKEPQGPYRVPVWDTGFQPDLDIRRLGQFADELDAATSASKMQ